ncbi:transmembrane protein 245 isoform X2 [Cydia splendana]|uniref:transmembrane protein 245 isoform X2 n=1 Tax=Cydia splendana TaxID=1100963 RepID=UPI00300C22B9
MQQSPFENIFNIIGGLSEGNEKPMKHGFYNAFALFILTICCAAVYVLFLILEPFFKPLFWALLVGSLLHPFKYKLSKKLKSWFEDLEKCNKSVVFGLMFLPVNVVNFASDTVGHQFIEHYKTVIGLLSAIFVLPWLYNAIPRSLVCIFWQLSSFIGFSTTKLIGFCSSYITLTIALAYLISICTLWRPERSGMFKASSQFLWLVITSFLASLTGSLQVYTFVMLQGLCVAGFALEVIDVHKELLARDPETSAIVAIQKVLTNEHCKDAIKQDEKPEQSASEQESTPEKESPSPATPDAATKRGSWAESDQIHSSPRHAKMLYKTRTLSALPLSNTKTKSAFENRLIASFKQRSMDENYMKNHFNSDDETALYFKLLFFGCLCMLVWKHIWLLPVMLFFLAIHVLKRVLDFFGVWLFCENHYNNFMGKVKTWWSDRQSAAVPAHIRGIRKILSSLNKSIRDVAYGSVDTVSTCIVITGLITFLIVATIFIFIQIYSEAIVVVQLSGSLLNSTFVQNSELHAYLPEGWEEKLDSLIDNAYTYGKEGISAGVKSILKEGDPEKIARVEEQILQLWDRVYQSWVSGQFAPQIGPTVDGNAVQDSWDSFVHDISNTPGMFDYSGIVAWVQANVGTLSAIATSIWAPLASNVSLLAGSIGAFTSLLLSGGGAVINMFINLVVFFTTLFYLLACSNALYKPVEVITQVQPNFGPRLGIALSVAINQVFRASFKMALFYGLWTWLVHNLFGAKVVYLPSVLAAVLGAAPFLGPYLAGIPAALDVWLQGRPMAALMLPIAQAAPIAFLDAAVYAEIKDGGHPYVTGLAIAGGIFYLGPEGAILGPLLLCCLMVVLNLSSAFLRDTPSEERAALHSRVSVPKWLANEKLSQLVISMMLKRLTKARCFSLTGMHGLLTLSQSPTELSINKPSNVWYDK